MRAPPDISVSEAANLPKWELTGAWRYGPGFWRGSVVQVQGIQRRWSWYLSDLGQYPWDEETVWRTATEKDRSALQAFGRPRQLPTLRRTWSNDPALRLALMGFALTSLAVAFLGALPEDPNSTASAVYRAEVRSSGRQAVP